MARYTIDFSTNASYIVREIEKVNSAIAQVARTGKGVEITLNTASLGQQISTTFKQIDKEIAKLERRLRKVDITGPDFGSIAESIGKLQGTQQKAMMQKQVAGLRGQASAFVPESAVALNKELQATSILASQIAPNTEAWVNLQREIARINIELKAADKLAENVQLSEQMGAFSPGSLNALEAKLTILRNKAREISPDTTEWKALNKEIVRAEQGIERQTRKPLTRGQRFGAAGGAFLYGGGLGGGIGSAVGGIAGGLAGGVPGAFTGAAIGQAVDNLAGMAGGVTESAAKIQQLQRGLALASIDAKDFADAQAAITESSNTLVIPLEQVYRQFTQLRVNTKQYNMSVKDTQQILEGVVLAVSSVGGSMEDVDGAMRAVVQIFSKGKVQAEELRGQLGERFPGAVVKFAQANKMGFEELQTALEKGQVTIGDFVNFAKKNYKDYAGFSNQLATAPEFAGRRLEKAMDDMRIAIGSALGPAGSQIQDFTTQAIKDITLFVTQNKGELMQMGKDFATVFSGIVSVASEAGKLIIKVLGPAFGYISDVIRQLRVMTGAADAGTAAAEKSAAFALMKKHGPGRTRYMQGDFSYMADKVEYDKARARYDKAEAQFKAAGGSAALPGAAPKGIEFGGPGVGINMNVAGEDADKEKADKKKKYVSELAQIYQKELENELLKIEQDASIGDREKELQKASVKWRFEHLINTTEYNNKISAEQTQNIANLSSYLGEQKRLYELEKKQIDARWENVITKPLRDILQEDKDAQSQLEASVRSLASGKEEMTLVEKREEQIKRALVGLDEDQIKRLKPLINLVLQQAKTVQGLTDEQKKQNEALQERKRLEERVKEATTSLQQELAVLRAVTTEEQKRLKIAQEYKGASAEEINRIYQLEKVRDNIKATREIIDNFVSNTSSDYKGFLKSIISGEDAVDALKKFQEGLKDKVLTIFLDFTMAPVEKYFKEVVSGDIIKKLFPPTDLEKQPENKALPPMEANTEATNQNTTALNNLTAAIGGGASEQSMQSNVGNDLANQLMQERGYENIAGLQPLPLQRMYQQIGRPLSIIYQRIEDAKDELYRFSRQEKKRLLAPNPQRTQTILNRAQSVENTRQTWDPLRAQDQELLNRTNPNPRSKPSSASLDTLAGVARAMSADLFRFLNREVGNAYGILGDISNYLSEKQLEVLKAGIKEQLAKGVRPELIKAAVTGGNPQTGRANIRGAVSEIVDSLTKRGPAAPSTGQTTTPGTRYFQMDQLDKLLDQPQIRPGVESQFEGASLPFNMQKMSPVLGEIASASGGIALFKESAYNFEQSANQLGEDARQLASAMESNGTAFQGSINNIVGSTQNAAVELGEGPTQVKWQESLGKVVQGIGIAAGSIMGIAAGIGQIKKGGTSNVLGGIGSVLLSIGGAIGGISGLFPQAKKAANGAVWNGGFTPFRAFANGGTVSGPTLGLVGEGKYNEAIVPLPDGKSIPVQLGQSSRELLASRSQTAASSPVLSMSFETTTINGVEYVSRDQLETAMMETRKLAARDGANRGAALAIDRLQNSPNTRRRIGMS